MSRAESLGELPAPSAADLCELASQAVDVDRVSLWRWAADQSALDREHLYDRRTDEHRAGGRLRYRDLPVELRERPDEGSPTSVADVAAPESPYRDVSAIYFRPVGVRSLLQVPVAVSTESPRLLWLEHVGAPREWTQREQRVARIIASWWDGLEAASTGAESSSPGEGLNRALRTLADDGSLGLFLSDGDHVTAGSRAFCNLLGVQGADLEAGYALGSFLPEDLIDALLPTEGEGAGSGPRTVPLRRPDGTIRWGLFEAVTAAVDSERWTDPVVAGWVVDVTILKDRERELAELAYSDPLTGLANRRLLHEQGERAVALAERHDRQLGLLYLDLVGFKQVNDQYGHAVGDDALVEVASRLQDQFRASDVVARLGGDEFSILLTEVDDRSGVLDAAERLIDRLERPMTLADQTVRLGGSVGVALFPRHAETFADLLKAADQAMYTAKHGPRGRQIQVADAPPEGTGSSESDVPVVTAKDLRTALESDGLALEYQPIYRARSDRPVGAEALVRMRRAGASLLPAGAFLSRAEHGDDIGRVDLWVVRRILSWTHEGPADRPGWLSANVSLQTVGDVEWVERLAEAGRSLESKGQTVCLEVPWPGDEMRNGSGWTAAQLAGSLTTLEEAGFGLLLELTSAEPEALSELSALSARGVKVPQELLQAVRERTGASLEHILSWMQTGWDCPVTVSRLDDPDMREQIETLELEVFLQGRELCPPVAASQLPGGGDE